RAVRPRLSPQTRRHDLQARVRRRLRPSNLPERDHGLAGVVAVEIREQPRQEDRSVIYVDEYLAVATRGERRFPYVARRSLAGKIRKMLLEPRPAHANDQCEPV